MTPAVCKPLSARRNVRGVVEVKKRETTQVFLPAGIAGLQDGLRALSPRKVI